MKTILKIDNLKRILLSTFLGYLVGVLILYINLFGSSEGAPLMCAAGAMLFAIASLKNEKLDMLFKRKNS